MKRFFCKNWYLINAYIIGLANYRNNMDSLAKKSYDFEQAQIKSTIKDIN